MSLDIKVSNTFGWLTMCISIPVWQRTPWKVLCHIQALWSYSKYYDLSLSYFKGLIISTFILHIEITLYAAPSPSWNISTAVPRKVTSFSCSGWTITDCIKRLLSHVDDKKCTGFYLAANEYWPCGQPQMWPATTGLLWEGKERHFYPPKPWVLPSGFAKKKLAAGSAPHE